MCGVSEMQPAAVQLPPLRALLLLMLLRLPVAFCASRRAPVPKQGFTPSWRRGEMSVAAASDNMRLPTIAHHQPPRPKLQRARRLGVRAARHRQDADCGRRDAIDAMGSFAAHDDPIVHHHQNSR